MSYENSSYLSSLAWLITLLGLLCAFAGFILLAITSLVCVNILYISLIAIISKEITADAKNNKERRMIMNSKEDKQPNIKGALLFVGILLLIVLFVSGPQALLGLLKKAGGMMLGLVLVCVISGVGFFIIMSIKTAKEAREKSQSEKWYAEERKKRDEERETAKKAQAEKDSMGDMNLF